MDIKKLKNKQWLINHPKDLFEEVVPCSIESLDAVVAKHTREIEALSDHMKSFFFQMKAWAHDAISNGTYDARLPYRTRIILTVVNVKNEKAFFLFNESSNRSLFFTKVLACFFEGYLWSDKLFVYRKDGVETCKGSVQYYGTHAASETFCLYDKERSLQLVAHDFELGDSIAIETIKHASKDAFYSYLVQMSSLIGKIK